MIDSQFISDSLVNFFHRNTIIFFDNIFCCHSLKINIGFIDIAYPFIEYFLDTNKEIIGGIITLII